MQGTNAGRAVERDSTIQSIRNFAVGKEVVGRKLAIYNSRRAPGSDRV